MSTSSHDNRRLEGNGVGLVREIALASRIQRGLENLYRLDRAANVDDFVSEVDVEAGERETLLVRETADGYLEMSLRLPKLGGAGGSNDDIDPICQIIEGVSHFVYLAHRAARERETTQLELELQAEVDKYVVLAASQERFDVRASNRLRERLYESVLFTHAASSVEGERYRIANDRAHRYTGWLERELIAHGRYAELRAELRRFFHLSQADKLRAA